MVRRITGRRLRRKRNKRWCGGLQYITCIFSTAISSRPSSGSQVLPKILGNGEFVFSSYEDHGLWGPQVAKNANIRGLRTWVALSTFLLSAGIWCENAKLGRWIQPATFGLHGTWIVYSQHSAGHSAQLVRNLTGMTKPTGSIKLFKCSAAVQLRFRWDQCQKVKSLYVL
jgi:hypothetical protein